jgi:hypothetical protein
LTLRLSRNNAKSTKDGKKIKESNDNAERQALGRSKGGYSSKIVGVCDAAGRLLDFVLVPGQAHELAPTLQLLKRLPRAPTWALADMACDATEFRSAVEAMGATPVVPSRKNAKQNAKCRAAWPSL